MTNTTKKITKATFKSFIKKNNGKLHILKKSDFDGMQDCVVSVANASFQPVVPANHVYENNLGIQGVWLVGGSRDYFSHYQKNGMIGIEVYNCCGSFVVAKYELA